jgi:hypothetical protein
MLLDEQSVLYSPSTIAIAALLVAFSLCHIDFSTMVDSIPDFLYPKDNDIFTDNQRYFLDVDRCIEAFEIISVNRACKRYMDTSPTSVIGVAD